MGRYPSRFLFSQLSGIAVGGGALLASGLGIRYFFGPLGAAVGRWAVLGVVSAMVLFAFLAMVLWGKVLVWLHVLTAEEARGYPYSKPWERDA